MEEASFGATLSAGRPPEWALIGARDGVSDFERRAIGIGRLWYEGERHCVAEESVVWGLLWKIRRLWCGDSGE